MQWPLTSQLHGSVSQREQLVFCYGSNSTPEKYLKFGENQSVHNIEPCSKPASVVALGPAAADLLESAALPLGADFMNQSRPKFTQKTRFGQVKDYIMT
jgi:hypothetical protein